MPYQLIYAADAKLCHIFTKLLCNKLHKVHHIFRFSAEVLSQLRVLGCHAYRAGIQVADSHHYTAHGNQGRCCKAKFLCSQNCGNGNVTAAHQLSVCLYSYLISKAVHDQRLMGLCKSKLPGKSCIVNGISGRRSGASVISRNQNDLCPCLCHTGGYRTHTGF